jgi:hypothetical protein
MLWALADLPMSLAEGVHARQPRILAQGRQLAISRVSAMNSPRNGAANDVDGEAADVILLLIGVVLAPPPWGSPDLHRAEPPHSIPLPPRPAR